MVSLQTAPRTTAAPTANGGVGRMLTAGSVVIGLVAALVLSSTYVLVLGTLGGAEHLGQQAAADWPWLVVLIGGFGAQVALVAELNQRRRMSAQARGAAGASAGTSLVAMAACCAHHVADLLPLVGATGLAVFLTSYRTPLLAIGVASTAMGIAVSWRRLQQYSSTVSEVMS